MHKTEIDDKIVDLIKALLRGGHMAAARVVEGVRDFVNAPGAPNLNPDTDVRNKMGK